MNQNSKSTFIILVIILSISFVVNVISFRNGHKGENTDFAAYVGQAKGIVEGTLNEFNFHNRYRYENSTRQTGALTASWGFPFILTPVYYASGLNMYAMKVYNSLFFLFSLLIVFLLFKDQLNDLQALLLVAILAFNTWFFDFKDNILSDYSFLSVSLLSLLLIKKTFILKEVGRTNKYVRYSLIGLFIFISYFIRPVGLVLLPTLLCVQVVESIRSKESLLSNKFNYIPHIVFLILAGLYNWFSPGGIISSYLGYPSMITIKSLIFDIKYYTVLPSRFFPFLHLNMNAYGFSYNKLSLLIFSVMLLLVFWGMIRNIMKDYIYTVYIFITMIVIMTFSGRQGFRLVMPLFPFFLYFIFIGLSRSAPSFAVLDKIRENFDKYIPLKIRFDTLFGCLLLLISLFYISQAIHEHISYNRANKVLEGPFTNDSVELFEFIKTNTNREDAVISYQPRIMTLFTDRKSFSLNRYSFKLEHLLNSHADYIAYNKKRNAYSLTAKEFKENFNCMFENETFIFCAISTDS